MQITSGTIIIQIVIVIIYSLVVASVIFFCAKKSFRGVRFSFLTGTILALISGCMFLKADLLLLAETVSLLMFSLSYLAFVYVHRTKTGFFEKEEKEKKE
ncbi:MAG: hypothetical protein UR78_C0003G0014 [Candidatus Moranbacteria bacterium GW2011_GWF2_35_39]|nr:MAG: hypothetical protein UR78_C0003G0014 [Candidatus Moranbacteria bacterium GW2011_GWF2_35_39]OGI31845.1 MAG: hypothetical protein A2343_01355 [Candidatus Moranbacteria bacterium RIFOXYB12_FULL_35_8]